MISDVVKTLLRTAGCGLFCLLLVSGDAWAQTSVPGAPTITEVGGHLLNGHPSLYIAWTTPSDDDGSVITTYDVRYIETAADETDDANWTVVEDVWTSGDLSYRLLGLIDSTEYDVQMRAVNTNGDGDWSATTTGTTPDYRNDFGGAVLTLGSPIRGIINPGTDTDLFEFRLTRETGILIWTVGDLDTVGELQNSSGTVIDSDDDGPFSDAPLSFFMWQTLAAGTYRIKVSSYGEATGSYTLRTRTIVDTSSISNAQEITFDSAGNGAGSGLIDPGDDTDYFTFTLNEETDIVIRTTGLVGDTVGTLLNSDGTEILALDDDGYLWPNRYAFLIRTRLNAGVYYIEVEGFDPDEDTGWYTLHVNKGTEPGNTIATATPLKLGIAEGSRIDPSNDEDYFRLVVPETTHIFVGATSETVNIDGDLLDSDGNPVDTILYETTVGDDGPWGFFLADRLEVESGDTSATYYIKVTRSGDTDPGGDDTGPYTIRAFELTSYNRFLADCADIDDTVSDPLYGCQWHLNNTGQLKGGESDEDINVEEVWDDNNLGAGINVVVVDDGMDYTHEDLSANVIAARNHDYTAGEGADATDIFHPLEDHGTAVAGLIAARDNSLGVRGVAPQAKIYGYNFLLAVTDANRADAMTRNLATTGVSNNSWGFFDEPGLDPAPPLWREAVDQGITEGFGGKGIFYAWAAGNGGTRGDYSTLEEYVNHHGVTAVCAVNDQGKRSVYSEEGANLWVCAPSSDSSRNRHGITTTDNDDFYRNSFGGTSAATPIVSGVAALVRSANSNLTWRDVKLILAASARKNDETNAGWEDGALQYGSATERYHFNHEYGFGVVDAKAAVDLADGWTILPALVEETAETSDTLNLNIPSLGTVSSRLTLGSDVEFAEFVEINTDFNHASFRDLQLELTSPSGKVSVLSVPYEDHPWLYPLHESFRFGSAKHLGEDPAGTWRLRISDRISGGTTCAPEIIPCKLELKSWSLTVYGHRSTPGAPDLDSLTPKPGALTVVWKTPDNSGASAVTAYDVRYIKTTEDETDDDNWTVADTGWTSGDDLQYPIPNLSDDVAYDVQVRAVNAQGAGPWSDTITETPSGDAPYFSEGTDTTRSVDENATAGADVGLPVGAEDPTDETLTYRLSGTDVGSFAIDDSTGQLTVADGAELDHETKDSYTVIVTATDPVTTDDPSADSDSINVTISVEDVDESPILTGKDSVSHVENRIRVTKYDADDPEGESLTWWLVGADHKAFTINDGLLSFDIAPDHDRPTDTGRNNIYEVTVVASDRTSRPATLPVTVTVTNVDEVHTLTELFRVSLYAENDTGSVAEYSVSDPEGAPVTWTRIGPDARDFTITDGVLRFTTPPNYEASRSNVYQVTVQAKAGSLTVPQAVTVRVTNVDEPPTLTGPPVPSEVSYDENSTTRVATFNATDPEGKTIIWSVAGTDDDDFTISNGVLTFESPPDYEAADSHTVTVHASDGTTRPATQALTITVNNLDEAGSLTLSSEQPEVETLFTATLTDPDGASDIIWVWESRPTDSGTWEPIAGATSDSYTPAVADEGSYLRARVTYTDGHAESGSKSLQREATNRVRAAQGNNNFPVFPDTPTTRTVQENTAAERKIGAPIVATDLDDDPLTYALDAFDGSVFAIDENSGQLRTKAALDHEDTPSYFVTVTATDPSRYSDSVGVTITVEDEDEPPTLEGPSNVPYEENSSGIVYTFRATDPEDEPITWVLEGADRNAFEDINLNGGILRFLTPPDYEKVKRYTVTVEASAGSHTARQPVTVSVTNVNEEPEISRPADTAITYTENDTEPVATYRATDPEGDPIQWMLEDTDADAFTITGGVLRFRTPPDYEAGSSYAVTVTVSDGELTDELDVTVTVTNEEEAGRLTLSSVQPQVDTALTAILTDPEGVVSTDWVWERSRDNKQTWEEIKGASVAGETYTTYTPGAADLGAYLRVSVTYTDGAGASESVQIVSPHAVRTAPVNNDPPAFTETTTTLTVRANARAGSHVGAVRAEDPGDPLTYTLDEKEPDAACFSIDWISGQITVGPGGLSPCADPATRSPGQRTISTKADDPKTTYEVTVIVTDPSGESDEIPVFITVTSSPPPPPPRPPSSPPVSSGSPRGGTPGGDATQGDDTTAAEPTGYLENPGDDSFQSGIGVISGWVCEAEQVEIEIETERGETERQVAAYGTERLDTAQRKDGTPLCGDTDNGFGLLFNWNRLGAGEHTVVAYVDDVELGRAVVRVTTVGEGAEAEFLRGAEGECVVADFPMPGETATLEWQQTSQNFVITDAE